MPRRRYHPRVPPTRLDHLLAHPYEIVLAAVGLAASAGILAAKATPMFAVSESVAALNGLVAWILGILGIPGHALIIRGLFDDHPDLMVGWRRERYGLVLAGSSWLLYASGVAWVHPHPTVSYGFAGGIVAAMALRLAATYAEERNTRAVMAAHKEAA